VTAGGHSRRAAAGFTLAEVLAAMLFLALVIPAAVEALHVAGLAGEVAVRKSVAARVADRVLNESLVQTNWTSGTRSGTIDEGTLEFRWTLTSQNWPQDAMQLVTARVEFAAQNKDYWVTMCTLANPSTAGGMAGTTTSTLSQGAVMNGNKQF
jgi:Tfp pilus assembly protein PilV